MKEYLGKTLEDALQEASNDLGTDVNDIIYTVEDEKRGIFAKKVVINVYELADVIQYAEDYVLKVVDSLGIESTVNTKLDDEIIHITIDSTHNPILIGKNGKTLQAINDLVKVAVSNHFRKRFRILLDINGYKDSKYSKLSHIAKRAAKEVLASHQTITLDPMPADERRIIHNALTTWKGIKTESCGEGNHRQVQIFYVGGEDVKNEVEDIPTVEEEIKD